MNILTFDIEEWAQAKAGGYGNAELYAEYDGYLDKILDALDERGFKGTFFCTGMMATDFPQVVKLICSRGHEVGCHSFKHTWLNKMTEEEVMEDTRSSVDALEQCIGEKVKSYRAPAFSIGKENKWAFEILVQNGITRDASVYPAERDFGGFAQFGQKKPTMVYCNTTLFKEFPICTTKLWGHEIAYSGGGYFRFFPLSFIKKEMAKSDYSMSYFHIRDLIPEKDGLMSKEDFEQYYKIPGTLKNRYLRYIKTNLGKKKAFGKMMELIGAEEFINLEQADKMIDWEQAPSVLL
jgi:polysaccharide deacetylase family protein (PEP-CTERM system associated)